MVFRGMDGGGGGYKKKIFFLFVELKNNFPKQTVCLLKNKTDKKLKEKNDRGFCNC